MNDPFSTLATPVLLVVFVFAVLLIVATILMPLYVIAIHSCLRRMEKRAAENAKRIEMLQVHVGMLKKRWLDEGTE